MESTYEEGTRFMRQLLLHRYKLLLEKVGQTYAITDDQMRALQEKILTIDWIDL
jgi:hypothetical protein